MSQRGTTSGFGNSPRATGSQHYAFLDLMPAHVKTAYDQSQPGPLEAIEKDAALGPIAANYIRTHPLEEVRLALRKLRIFFTFDPSHEKGRSFIYWVPLVILNSLAEWGAFFRRSTLLSGNDLFLVVPIFFAIAISTVKFVLPSYKIAIDLFLMIIAANVFINSGQSSPSNNSPCKSLEKLRIRHGTARFGMRRRHSDNRLIAEKFVGSLSASALETCQRRGWIPRKIQKIVEHPNRATTQTANSP